MEQNILVYDFEVFKEDWLVVLKDRNSKSERIIVNDVNLLKMCYHDCKDWIWVGYNSRNYDSYILKAILMGYNPYNVSVKMIEKGMKGHNVVKGAWKIPFNNFDITTGFHSLKQLEGFMGNSIKESSVPFDIQRKLTKQELEEVIDYCQHDVRNTVEVFESRIEEYESQLGLIQAFNLDMTLFNKTKAQLSAHILGAEKLKHEDEFNISIPDTLLIGDKYKHIVDWYLNPENMDYSKKLKTEVAGVEHIFAFGGLHGSIKKRIDEGIILCMDVASLYPSLMIEYNLQSRCVKNQTKYVEIRDKRLEYKAAKNPLQAPLKIVLNSTYGAMKDVYNNLYDPLMANNVCIYGQLLLLDLIEKIEPYGELLQSNTDGVFIKLKSKEDIEVVKRVASDWEKRTRLNLEWEVCSKLITKDVNNYILVGENGKCKTKGAYVKKLSKLDYDLPIVNKALLEYFINNIPVEDTINNCDDLIEFQKIVKVTRLYICALHGEEKLKERVLRVYADIREDAKGVFKLKDKGEKGLVAEKIANTPEKCFIWNDSVKDVKCPDYLDRQYYINVTKKRIIDFVGKSNLFV